MRRFWPPMFGDECSKTFKSLKQEEADPGPARVALAAPAHAVLSHGCVGAGPPRLGVHAASAARVLVSGARSPASASADPRRQTREVQFVLHHTITRQIWLIQLWNTHDRYWRLSALLPDW